MKLVIVLAVLLICITYGVNGVKYTKGSGGTLFAKVHDLCCPEESKKREDAAAFLEKISVSKRARWEECCWEGCSWEEIDETSLIEECVHEGCSDEEIAEKCD